MEARAAARAIDALRRGWPVRVTGRDGALIILPIDGIGVDALTAFDPDGTAPLLLSGTRAATLKLINQRDAADPEKAVLVERPAATDDSAESALSLALATADPVRDLMTPLKGPYHALPLPAADCAAAALRLARLAGLLPAFFVRPDEEMADADAVGVEDVARYEDAARLVVAARARLPVATDVRAEIVAFRSPEDAREHVALILGVPDSTAPVVRLHSECLTGDVLGSLKCDCGPQLHAALHEIAEASWGVLLYLRQEGRGIGLINKLRAYELQDQGFDTVDANLRLGFAIDARDFSVAARMLSLLDIAAVRLLTNNPAKVAGLEGEGIKVVERLPLAVAANPHNARYLATKRDRTGHQL